jgi:hypothetical protein
MILGGGAELAAGGKRSEKRSQFSSAQLTRMVPSVAVAAEAKYWMIQYASSLTSVGASVS